MFNSIEKQYKDTKTKRGHEIKVDRNNSKITIWYQRWNDEGHDNFSKIGIAQITEDRNTIRVGWFQKDEHEPSSFSYFKELQEAFKAIDERINLY
ncbi:MAG: hypothetical protein V1782_09865 [Pseudomonadota bacterium]